jgi:Kdo2-lipid IVA lauroyltransferase/acyltransferase
MFTVPRTRDFLKRRLLYPLEAAGTFVVYWGLALLPLGVSSAIGGFLARAIGPRLSLSQRAVKNLSRVFPDKTPAEIAVIVRDMWDNLGRVAAEFPHLKEINVYDPHGIVQTTGGENVDLLRDDGRPGIFFSGHIGNWEIVSLGATQRGVPVDRVYRSANNRLVEWLYRRGRAAVEGALIPKGPAGVRQLLKIFSDGGHLGMLVDQKMNDGIPVPFFGREAMTAPALAEFALKFDCPVVAARVIRLKGPRFRLEILPPLTLVQTGDRHADVLAAMTQVNAIMEAWIREYPGQWLWLHNRWPD